LVFEPMLLFNVGFLLSYFAVLSIIAVVPLLEDIFYLKRNFIKDGFWIVILENSANYFIGILLVSLAAQIGTAMLSISTFNQFPLYFMLTNVIVIPVAFLIMISAVLLLLTSGISYIAMALNFLLNLLINSVTWIENLPGACAEGIFVTKISMCLLYVVILFLTLFFIYKNVKTLKFALSTALILVLLTGYFGMFSSETDCLTVWNKEKYTCISYLKQDSCVVLTSKRGSAEGVFLSPIKNLMSIKGTKKLTVLQTNVIEKFSDFYFQICGKNVLVLNNAKQLEMLDGLKVDLLIITENVNFNISRLLEKINPEKVIFASSNRENYVREKAEEFLSHNIKVHNVNISGAFVEGFFSEVIWRY
jgi:competence protein ComEC